ncbi:MAG: MOSC domain-containing protein [Acidimicrobiia bacterium]
MASNEVAGAVAALWRFPVKSMLGERLDGAGVTGAGLVGDRAYALVEMATGTAVSAKRVQEFPDLFACRAAFVEPPQPGGGLPPVRITLPDGSAVTSDAGDADATLSRWFGRDVHLASGPGFFDLYPISVLTTSTLDELDGLRPGSRFDERRFRMNVVVRTSGRGFVENAWVGRVLEVGDGVRLGVAMPDPRCVMTTLAQEELPRDREILRTLSRHNRLEVGGEGRLPCCGVYAVVDAPGTIRAGDAVIVR